MTETPSEGSDREHERLEALRRLAILDTAPEQVYDDLVLLASQVCGTPIALVSLVDEKRQWFKAKVGLDADETHRDYAFCGLAIKDPDTVLEVEDAARDPRFSANPLVVGDPNIRFYAGAPIVTAAGHALGTVCVIDAKPRRLDTAQVRSLQALARYASHLMSLREAAIVATQEQGRLRDENESLEGEIVDRTRERDDLWSLSVDLLVKAAYDGRLVRVSPSWTRVLGYAERQLLETNYRELSHPDHVRDVDDGLRRARRSGTPATFEDRLVDASGTWHWIEWTVTPMAGGEMFTGIGRNVSDAKAQRARLDITEESLRQSQKMEAVGQLTGGIAHDFNNLLAGITGSLELLKIRIDQGRVGEAARYINAAQGATKRASSLTHRLLAFARRQTLEAKPTDLNRLVAGLEELVRRTVEPHVDVEIVGSSSLWPTLIDANQLENAVLNLCINARDAMPDGGRLTIETANKWIDDQAAAERDLVPGQYVTLCVTDTGTGMPPDVVKRAFDPFYTTKPLGAGTGLGLSMVYGLARQSNGQVRIYSEVGIGTTVCIYLPRHLGPAEEQATETGETSLPVVDAEQTVLVVDDEPTVRMMIADVLTDGGYRVLEANTGAAGLRILQSPDRVDLLVTDVGLPGGMNGRQLADAGRSLRPGLQILFVTGYAENAVIGDGQLGAGLSVLTKPFGIQTLERKVHEILADTPDRRPAT